MFVYLLLFFFKVNYQTSEHVREHKINRHEVGVQVARGARAFAHFFHCVIHDFCPPLARYYGKL